MDLLKDSVNFLKYRTIGTARFLRFILHHQRNKIRYGSSLAGPYHVIRVDANQINSWVDLSLRDEIGFTERGCYIVGGDWDEHLLHQSRQKPRFKKMATSFERHFNDGVPWEKTQLFNYAHSSDDIHDIYDPKSGNLEERLQQLDELYERLKEDGYKTQRELEKGDLLDSRRSTEIPVGAPPEIHEIGIAITRSGDFCWFCGGNHRLLIAQLLDLKNIPVRVVVRHEIWQDIRHEIATTDASSKLSDEAKEYVDHPDVRDIIKF